MDDFLIHGGYAILLLNIILYSISFFRQEKGNVFFVSYLLFLGGLQFAMEVLFHLQINNLILVNLYFLGQFILLGLFFKSFIENKQQQNFIIYSLIVAVGVIIIQNCCDTQLLFQFNLFAIVLTGVLLVCFALIHLYNQLTSHKLYYYVTIGILLYTIPSSVLFLVGNLTKNLSNDFKYLSWQVNAFLFIVLQLFYLYEWMVSFSKKASTTNKQVLN